MSGPAADFQVSSGEFCRTCGALMMLRPTISGIWVDVCPNESRSDHAQIACVTTSGTSKPVADEAGNFNE